MKEIHNKRRIKKRFDATKNCFKQFIDLRANFETYEFKKKIEKRLKNVKKFQIKCYDRHHNSQFYKVENRIWLNFKNIIFNRFSKKLNFKFYESYEITNFVKKMTYRLTLFKAFQFRDIYDVFHVSLFESYIDRFDLDSKSFVIEMKEKKQ